MDDITKQIFLEKIRVSIDDYKNHADELFKLINIHFENETDTLRNIAKLTLQRFYAGLISISPLIDKFRFYKPIEYTYALIFRTSMLDFITLEYLKVQRETSNDAFNKSLEKINYLTADDANRYCDAVEKDKEGFRNFIATRLFPENFEYNTELKKSILKKTKPLQAWKMAQFFKDKPISFAYDAYRLYNHYSLTAHFNNMTFDAMQGDNKSDIRNMIWVMFYIFQGHYTCLEILDFFPKHSPEILKKRDYFLELNKQLQ